MDINIFEFTTVMGTISPQDREILLPLFDKWCGHSIDDMQHFLYTGESRDHYKFKDLRAYLNTRAKGCYQVKKNMDVEGERYIVVQIIN